MNHSNTVVHRKRGENKSWNFPRLSCSVVEGGGGQQGGVRLPGGFTVSPGPGAESAYLSGSHQLPQRHGHPVLGGHALQRGQRCVVVAGQHVVAGALRKPLQRAAVATE